VAKAIATIGGVGLAPGISKNRRLYTPEHIVGAVARAQKRLKDGTEPMVMLTHHAAGDDSREISGSLTAVSLDENGRLRFASDLPDTPAGWDIANLASTADGQPPFLRNVSIRGYWTGTVRTVKGPDGQPVETADGLIIDGLDFTRSPGVADAQIDTFAWTADGARTETDERVPITESVQEARVTAITEETATEAAPQMTAEAREALRETLRALPPEPPVILRNGLCEASSAALPLSKRGSGLTGGSKVYADPGYQADGKQRYDLTTKALAKAAWSYVNQKDNAAKYTAAQLKRVKGRIMKALKAFGVKVAAEGWVIEPARQVTESELREWYSDYGSPQTSGSWSLNASNGPINLCLSCYGMDPADLDLILRAAADAACKALAALDPDMDGDIDVDGAGSEDTDHDGGAGETAPADGPASVAEATDTTAPEPAAGETTERTESAMPETTAPAAETTAPAAPAYTQAQLDAIIEAAANRALAAFAAAHPAPAAGTAAAAPAAEAAPAAPAAPAAVTETEAEKVQRMVDAAIAAKFPQETDEQRITRLVQEGVDAATARMVQSGQLAPGRKGIVMTAEQAAAANSGADVISEKTKMPASWGDKPLHEMSHEDLIARTAPVLANHVFGERAAKIA